jgi:hypothetical protein
MASVAKHHEGKSMSSPKLTSAHEFSEEQNKTIASLASCMGAVGVFLLIIGAIQLVVGVSAITQGGVRTLIEGLLSLVIGGFTQKAAGAFRQIVNSTGNDLGYLMSALGTLRDLYRLQVVALVAAMAIALLAVMLLPLLMR